MESTQCLNSIIQTLLVQAARAFTNPFDTETVAAALRIAARLAHLAYFALTLPSE